jgi:hypothetical protein
MFTNLFYIKCGVVFVWITNFLTDRSQQVRLGNITSSTRTISTGAPFSLYTNDCTSGDPSVKLLKFADDTTVIGLIRDGDESAYRREVDQLALWCNPTHSHPKASYIDAFAISSTSNAHGTF